MGDLLGENIALAQASTLYRCLDRLTAHKQALFSFLRERWKDMFDADFDVLLHDLTSTCFESDPPESGKRKFGYSRDKRPDCVRVAIALIVTPQGFPFTTEDVLALYRLRWRIELAFKRLKSLIGLKGPPGTDERSAKPYVLAHLLMILLLEPFVDEFEDSPHRGLAA